MKIIVCGGGALGSHFVYLARELPDSVELAVVDFDRVETRNLFSQWFVRPMVGKYKSTALKLQWQNFYGKSLRDFTVRLAPENVATLLGDAGLVIDCFDNAASRHLIQDHVRGNGLPCLHGGLAARGEFGAVRWDSDFTVDAEDIPGQVTCDGRGHLPLIVTTSSALFSAADLYLETGVMRNWNLTPGSSESF